LPAVSADNPLTPTLSLRERESRRQSGRVRVMLKIYNILSREVATLVNTEQPPGNYEVKWNAAGQASGVYFYRLQAGEMSITKKMILVR
jgi:hypothetical protein